MSTGKGASSQEGHTSGPDTSATYSHVLVCTRSGHRMICGVQFGDRTEAHFPSPNPTRARINANATVDILFRSSNWQLPGKGSRAAGETRSPSCPGPAVWGHLQMEGWRVSRGRPSHLCLKRSGWFPSRKLNRNTSPEPGAPGLQGADTQQRWEGGCREAHLRTLRPARGLNYILRRCLNLGFQLYQEHKEHLFSNKNILVGARERWNI